MNRITVVALWLMLISPFLACSRGAFAQQTPTSPPSAEKFPPDIHSETMNRMPAATKDELTTDEEKQAYDRLVAVEPRFAKPQSGGTGVRLHAPVVAETLRNAYNWLRERS